MLLLHKIIYECLMINAVLQYHAFLVYSTFIGPLTKLTWYASLHI